MADIAAGFQRLEPFDKVMAAFDPIYMRIDPDGLALGFHVGPQHCNPSGHCHGGTWATMADIVMGMNVGFATGMAGPTVSLSIDFLGAAAEGQWVEGHAEVLRSTPNLAFAECRFTADATLALRANAVFRRKVPPYRDYASLVARP